MKILEMEQYSDEWWEARCGKPSGSNAKKLVSSTGALSKSISDYAIELAGDMFAGKSLNSFDGNQWTERGSEMEEEARIDYQMRTQNEVTEVGMIMDDDDRWLVSPDGLVGDSSMVEIKCLSPKVHIKALMYFEKTGKAPAEHISQCQMQMMVAEREHCDLFLYHPDLPSLIIKQLPDVGFQAKLMSQLKQCIAERNIAHKLLDKYNGK